MLLLASSALVLAVAAGSQAQPVPAVPPPPAVSARSAAYYHYSLAQQARMAGRFDEALDEYRKAQKEDPGSGAIRAETARLLREAGRLQDALAEAREGTRVDPKSAQAHLILAQLYLAQAESEQAEEPLRQAAAGYEKALELDPEAQTLRELAAIYSQLNEHAKAAKLWQRYVDEFDADSFEAYLQLGAHHLALNDAEAAAQALKKAVEIEPSARAYQSLGDVFRAVQKGEESIKYYRQSLELEPRNVQVRLKLADVLYRERKFDDTVAESNAVLAADPDNRFALELKGKSLRDLKRFDEALALANQSLARDANDLSAAYLKATVSEARRDYAAAVEQLERLLARPREGEDAQQRASNDRAFLLHLGLDYQQLNRYAEAAEAYGRAFALTGRTEAGVLAQRVQALVRARDLDRALSEVRDGRKRFPDEVQLVTLEATVLREQGKTDEAIRLAEGLRQKSAGKFDALLEVAEFYQQAKRYGDAEQVLADARKVQPKDLRALFLLGAVLERQKRHDAAEAVFREALGVEPDSAPVLNYLGYMNADRGVRLEEALTLIERAVAIDPENGAYLDSLGWALFRLKRFDQAEEHLRRAVSKGSPNAVVLDHLGDVLQRRGNVREALDYWQRALKGEDDDGELDRATVERKIKEAQAGADEGAHRQPE
jgi:tetratricopeptide (TPR) repeat protein